MKELNEEIWEKLEKLVSKKYPLLIFSSILDESEIAERELPTIDYKTTIYVHQHYNSFNTYAVGAKYSRLFTYKHPDKYIPVEAVIDFVRLKKGQQIFFIPEGYGGVCRLYFPDGLPEQIKLVPKGTMSKFDREKNDIIYLTTDDIMDKLLTILNE
jgi:hypothetical protein